MQGGANAAFGEHYDIILAYIEAPLVQLARGPRFLSPYRSLGQLSLDRKDGVASNLPGWAHHNHPQVAVGPRPSRYAHKGLTHRGWTLG